eukprot:scaffold1264_cov149-Ochromonas_danica.AAC.2
MKCLQSFKWALISELVVLASRPQSKNSIDLHRSPTNAPLSGRIPRIVAIADPPRPPQQHSFALDSSFLV